MPNSLLVWFLLLAAPAFSDTILLASGASYEGHYMGAPNAHLNFQDNQGIQYNFPVSQIQTLAFGQDGDTVTLRTGRSYFGHLAGPENDAIQFVDQQGISYRFPTNSVASLVFSGDWGGNFPSQGTGIVLPAGAEITVLSNLPIDSRNAQPGQTFPASITQDVLDPSGQIVIPRNSDATLLLQAENGGGIHQGDIVLDLDSVTINGVRHRVATSDVVKTNHQKLGANRRTAGFLGGGAALGALIGAIAGGGRGAAIGAAAGAGAGVVGEITTHGKRVYIPAETALTFELERPLVLRPFR
jgi:hypothetical protein